MSKPGTVSDIHAALWDMYPTFLGAAGIPVTQKIDGISLLNALKGEKQKQHNYLYWEFHEEGGKQAVRWGEWKGVRLNINTISGGPVELYNIRTDPQEKNNIASKHPEIVKRIESMMRETHVSNKDWPLTVQEINK